MIRCAFADFGQLQRALEDRGITPISAELECIPQSPLELPEDQATKVLALIDQLERTRTSIRCSTTWGVSRTAAGETREGSADVVA